MRPASNARKAVFDASMKRCVRKSIIPEPGDRLETLDPPVPRAVDDRND
jgi:hypothetical protein